VSDDSGVNGDDVEADAEAEDEEEVDDDYNRIRGAIPKNVLEYVARNIVDEPDAVVVEVEDGRRGISLNLHVAPDDMGKVIGRRGRVAQAIRSVVRAAGAREGIEAQVEIVD
jgi:predicted RNA-binding protein YlqC (UPF0109 family)